MILTLNENNVVSRYYTAYKFSLQREYISTCLPKTKAKFTRKDNTSSAVAPLSTDFKLAVLVHKCLNGRAPAYNWLMTAAGSAPPGRALLIVVGHDETGRSTDQNDVR